MNPFTEMIRGLKPIFEEKLRSCPNVAPDLNALKNLKVQLIDGKRFFVSFGKKGSLDFVQNCALYGMLDKNNLPSNAKEWMDLIKSLLVNIEMAERANAAAESGLVDRVNVSTNVNVNTLDEETEVVNVEVEKKSWFSTPLFQFFGADVTPTKVMIGAVMYSLYKNRWE